MVIYFKKNLTCTDPNYSHKNGLG